MAIVALFLGILCTVNGFGFSLAAFVREDMGPLETFIGYVIGSVLFTAAFYLIRFGVM